MNGAGSKVDKTLLELGREGFLLCFFCRAWVTNTVTIQIHFFPLPGQRL